MKRSRARPDSLPQRTPTVTATNDTRALPQALFRSRRKLYWLLLGAALLLDQVTKALLWRSSGSPPRRLIPGVLDLISHPGNTRGAFGLGPQTPLFYVIAGLAGVVLTIVFLLATPAGNGLVSAALGLVAGGAVGNLIDRAALNHVRDFIDLHWGGHHWPTFNFADTAICIGFGLIVFDTFFPRGRAEPAAQAQDGAEGKTEPGAAERRSA